jgi:hypothetical protein
MSALILPVRMFSLEGVSHTVVEQQRKLENVFDSKAVSVPIH